MILHPSALIAILRQDADAEVYARAVASATSISISASAYLEVCIAVDSGRDPVAMRTFDALIAHNNVRIEPFTAEQAVIARAAHHDFGQVDGHPAKLDLSDCSSYALASVTGEPLLYKGDVFSHTDIASAI